jgi:hypothetical protein
VARPAVLEPSPRQHRRRDFVAAARACSNRRPSHVTAVDVLNHPQLRAAWVDQLLVAVLAGITTFLVIGHFGVRLANTSTDDGLVSYAYFFKFPELFARDASMLNWGPAALASMLNWLPAVLFKYAEIPPEIFFWLFTFLQNILLAIAMYRLAMVMVRSREVALITAVFTLAFRPHWWNMGLFADLNWMPYGGWLALPFLVFAGALALEQRLTATAVMLLIGGLVHPILGLFTAAMIGTYWLLLLLRERKAGEIIWSLGVLGIAAVAFLLPAIFVRLGIEEAPSSAILPLLLKNGHAIPWANPECEYCMRLFVKGLVVAPIMVALALLGAGHAGAHPSLRLFLAASAAVAFAACLLHVIGYFVESATVLRLISSRSTILLLIFAVPSVVSLAWRALTRADSVIARFIACYVLVWPSPMALLSALLALPGRDKAVHGPVLWLLRLCRTAAAIVFVLVLSRNVPRVGAWIDSYIIGQFVKAAFISDLFGFASTRSHTFLVIYICVLLTWHRLASRPRLDSGHRHSTAGAAMAPLALALVAPLTVHLLLSSYKSGRVATRGEPREYYEVQVWARSSTAVDATFIVGGTSVYEGWRNFTHRARISVGGCGFYVCTKTAFEEAKKADAFFARHGHPSASTVSPEGLKAFARAFGGDYAVRRKTWAPLDLPIAFQNRTYVVYDLR